MYWRNARVSASSSSVNRLSSSLPMCRPLMAFVALCFAGPVFRPGLQMVQRNLASARNLSCHWYGMANDEDSGWAESCASVETLVPQGSDNGATLVEVLDDLAPTGWTPLAAALETVGKELASSEKPGEQVVYVVTVGRFVCIIDLHANRLGDNTIENKSRDEDLALPIKRRHPSPKPGCRKLRRSVSCLGSVLRPDARTCGSRVLPRG